MKAIEVGVMADPVLIDVRALKRIDHLRPQGMAAMQNHAYVLDTEDPSWLSMQEMLEATQDKLSLKS